MNVNGRLAASAGLSLILTAWAFIGSAIFAGSGLDSRQKVDISTEDNVIVVHNPRSPAPQPGGPSKLSLTQDLVIGKGPAGGPDVFAELRSVGVDGRENIWTLDWEDIKVRVFDKTGKLISTFGQKGQGPREWQSPSRMIVLPEGTGVILDLNKLTFYSLDGTCLKELSTAKARMSRFRIDSRGTIYGDQMGFGETLKLKLVKHDPTLKPLATLAEIDEPFKVGAVSPIPILLYCHVTEDDRLVWMSNDKYEFHVMSPEGKLLRKIIKDYDPVKVTKADKDRLLEDSPAAMKAMLVFPDAFPPVNYFVGDPEGRLYVQTYETDDRGWLVYDVFDAEGRCVARFSLPREEMAFSVRKDKLYALITEDEEGIPLVKRYAMTWK